MIKSSRADNHPVALDFSSTKYYYYLRTIGSPFYRVLALQEGSFHGFAIDGALIFHFASPWPCHGEGDLIAAYIAIINRSFSAVSGLHAARDCDAILGERERRRHHAVAAFIRHYPGASDISALGMSNYSEYQNKQHNAAQRDSLVPHS